MSETESGSGEVIHKDDDTDKDETFDFEANDKDDDELPPSDNQATTTKFRSKAISYPYHSHYDSEKEANDLITHIDGFLDFKWKQFRQNTNSRGATRYYKCLKATYCPKLLQLRIDTTTEICTLSVSALDHNHTEKKECS